MKHVANALFVAQQLRMPISILFDTAYAYTFKVFSHRHEDIRRFEQGVVPQYVQDFIYAIIPETTEASEEADEAEQASPQMYFEGWDRRA